MDGQTGRQAGTQACTQTDRCQKQAGGRCVGTLETIKTEDREDSSSRDKIKTETDRQTDGQVQEHGETNPQNRLI